MHVEISKILLLHKKNTIMKKLLFLLLAIMGIGGFIACEHSDCECKYYDENARVIASESWDSDDVSSCKSLENNQTVEIDDEVIAANSVSCSQSW